MNPSNATPFSSNEYRPGDAGYDEDERFLLAHSTEMSADEDDFDNTEISISSFLNLSLPRRHYRRHTIATDNNDPLDPLLPLFSSHLLHPDSAPRMSLLMSRSSTLHSSASTVSSSSSISDHGGSILNRLGSITESYRESPAFYRTMSNNPFLVLDSSFTSLGDDDDDAHSNNPNDDDDFDTEDMLNEELNEFWNEMERESVLVSAETEPEPEPQLVVHDEPSDDSEDCDDSGEHVLTWTTTPGIDRAQQQSELQSELRIAEFERDVLRNELLMLRAQQEDNLHNLMILRLEQFQLHHRHMFSLLRVLDDAIQAEEEEEGEEEEEEEEEELISSSEFLTFGLNLIDSMEDDDREELNHYNEATERDHHEDQDETFDPFQHIMELVQQLSLVGVSSNSVVGATKDELDNLFLHRFNAQEIIQIKSCSICLNSFADGKELGALECQHWHCKPCLHQWLEINNACPICRIPLKSKSVEDLTISSTSKETL